MKKNCWEIKNCKRGPDGNNSCPAGKSLEGNGINDGLNGGRFCWAIAGTFCNGKVQGIFALKIENCLKCEVFQQIEMEEAEDFVLHFNELNKKNLSVADS